ncbi:MAG: hypothetical protein ABWY52_07565 [Candidatus Limnocylindrales bacterium]
MPRSIDVYFESSAKRTFAGAVDWPGWCRSAKEEASALAALIAYGPRYAAVLAGAPAKVTGPDFQPPTDPAALRLVERLKGGGATDFGVPGEAPASDHADLGAAEVKRLAAILRACWAALDRAAAAAEGVVLRKGPRGGGRDLDKILGHVFEAEQAYIMQLGSRPPKGDGSTSDVAVEREAAIEAFTARAIGRPLATPRQTRKPWTPRYFVRRAAWHVLDHAWEIEDRAAPE